MGKRRIEIKKIESLQARRVCFSKRRKGLFKKAQEYSGLSSDDVLSIVFSSAGRPFVLNTSSSSVESQLELYMKMKQSDALSSPDDFSNGEEVHDGDDGDDDELLEEEDDSEMMDLKDLQALLDVDIDALSPDQLDDHLSAMEKMYEAVRRARRAKEMATSSNVESSQEEYKEEELTLVVLQYLYEHNLDRSAHKLEQETGLFLNLTYVKELVINGEWEKADKYLSGFTKIEDNNLSSKLFFEIRKQKYLETLDKRDLFRASDILIKNLKVFEAADIELFKELKQLLSSEALSEHEQLPRNDDTQKVRNTSFTVIKSLIENNPVIGNKLHFPIRNNGRLGELIKQSLLYQHHQFCKKPQPNPEFETLFVDHTCDQPCQSQDAFCVANPPRAACESEHPLRCGKWITNASSLSPTYPGVALSIMTSCRAEATRPGLSRSNIVLDCQRAEPESELRKSIPLGISDETGDGRSFADNESGPSEGLTENSRIVKPSNGAL